ncbi:MAG: imidazole glycerol phosphate synthase subunit HisH [Dehalococcoidia bacterium]|nr:imidazole glycerol phosphate synthase subunit HisH [Dehalococcoidia bacterium]
MGQGRAVAILDYGAGNLRSVTKAVLRLGYPALVTADPRAMQGAGAVILPGVGAAADTMANLRQRGLVEPIREFIAGGRPFLGVCMGLQALLTGSHEGGWEPCLDIVPGLVKRLPGGQKVPHMGWNQVRQVREHPVFRGIPQGANFYFVHSYYTEPEDPEVVAARTEYGVDFCSVLIRDNLVATQFHPEKSGDWGLLLYENFLRWSALPKAG